MMRKLSLLLLTVLASAAQAEIYQCIDASGNKSFTNNKVEAAAAGCKLMNLPPVSSVPPPPKTGVKSGGQSAATPGGFPKVDPNTQQQRDDARKKILEQELASEQKLLDQAKRDLAEQEAIRLGSERNYQRVLDRLEPYKKKVALHESNIANLRKELSSLH